MNAAMLSALFTRDLNKLKNEVEQYRDEANIWRLEPGIANTAGNLCLHLLGNLNAYIGAVLAKNGYVRQRDLEFSTKDVAQAELLSRVTAAIQVVETGLNGVTAEQMNADFPIVIWDKPMSTAETLVRLLAHLNYHLGQINYHRRLLDK